MRLAVPPGASIDLRHLAGNLWLHEDGVWVSPEHQDLGFLETDTTDWREIEQRSFWYRHRNRCFVGFLGRFPPAGILLEIGAGNGSVALALQGAGHSVVALEPTVRLARYARARGLRNVVCSALEGAGFSEGAVPNVGMFDVLEHIQDDESYLAHVRRLMPSGGRLYCAVPAGGWLWSREDEIAEHLRRYSLRELRRKVEGAGFRVEFQTYFFVPLVLPIFLFRSVPSWLGIRSARTHDSSVKEHIIQPGLAASILEAWLGWESQRLSRGGAFCVGASCFIVARAN
jgi:SAM-dependent methyltransferase